MRGWTGDTQGPGVRGGSPEDVVLEGRFEGGRGGKAISAEEAANAKLLWWEGTWDLREDSRPQGGCRVPTTKGSVPRRGPRDSAMGLPGPNQSAVT